MSSSSNTIYRASRISLVACRHWVRKLQARYLAGDYSAALDALSRAQQCFGPRPRFFEEAEYCFYGALLRGALYDAVAADGDGRTSLPSVEASSMSMRWLLITGS